jgi:hypothetical protein
LDLWYFLFNLIKNNIPENTVLNTITLPFGLNFSFLYDNKFKNLFILSFGFTLLVHRSYILFKQVILWPFKLGIFSFIYSILGFDVSWFLNLFNVFSINVPHWVYFQYLTLYNNWIHWWYNTVNIKSINSILLVETNKLKQNVSNNLPSSENNQIKNNKVIWDVLAILAVLGGICFILWYIDAYGSIKPGDTLTPTPSNSNPNTSTVSNVVTSLTESNLQNLNNSQLNSTDQVQIINNQTKDPTQIINEAWIAKEKGLNNTNLDPSTSSSAFQALGNRSSSPTLSSSSKDSNETVRAFPLNWIRRPK